MKISIIIVNYNGNRTLKKCLDSVFNSSFKEFEVIVVDNNSKDDSWKIVESYNAQLIRCNNNYGFAEGNNIGIRKAKGEYIFLLNNDAYLEKNCLSILLNDMKENIGVTGCKIYYKDGGVWFSGGHEYFMGFMSHHYLNKRDYCDYVSGCAMLIKKSILNKIGLFDKKYFMYFEEADLCRRIRENNYKILYNPKAIVYHDIKKDRTSKNEVYYMFKNRVYYSLKNKKYKLPWKILDFIIFYPMFTFYKVIKNKKVLYHTDEIIRARIDSLK